MSEAIDPTLFHFKAFVRLIPGSEGGVECWYSTFKEAAEWVAEWDAVYAEISLERNKVPA